MCPEVQEKMTRIVGSVDAGLVDELHEVLVGRTERIILRNELKSTLEDIISRESEER